MLISEKFNEAANVQIGHELGNSNQYLAIAAFFERECLFGLAKIYFKQAEEERDHAMKFFRFVLDAGGKVVIPDVPAPGMSSDPPRRPPNWRSTPSCGRPGRFTTWWSWRRRRRTTSRRTSSSGSSTSSSRKSPAPRRDFP